MVGRRVGKAPGRKAKAAPIPKRRKSMRALIIDPPRRGIYRFNNMATMTLVEWRRIFRNGA